MSDGTYPGAGEDRSPLPTYPSALGPLLAAAGSLLLLLAVAAVPGRAALDSARYDLKHRWIALTGERGQPALPALQTAPRDLSLGNTIGVNVFLEQEVDPSRRQRSIDLLRAAGVGWLRQQMPWESIEPVAKGHYVDPNVGGSTWARFDDIVNRAHAAGLHVILRLDTTPTWALPPGSTSNDGPPRDDADYWDFVQTVAERYRGRVDAYQIWNEPNLTSEWGGRPPDPAAYARLLIGAAQRIRQADPHALILSAAMAPTLTDDAQAMNELRYWQALYNDGVRGAFDVLAVQAYGLRGGPDDPRIGPRDVTFSRPQLVRALMDRNGDAATPVWATEMGWDAPPADLQPQRFGRVTPTLQARYTLRGLARARQGWPWLQVMTLWYWKRADRADLAQDWYWFDLATPDFHLNPVYYGLRDFHSLVTDR